MTRLLALIAGVLGLGALLRRLREQPAPFVEPPVEDLRARLAATRSAAPADLAELASEQAVTLPPPVVEPLSVTPLSVVEPRAGLSDVAARRAEVHERARKAIDELGSSSG